MADEERKESLTMIVYSDNFDKLTMPMILAQGAIANGWDVHIFYTFFGLRGLLKRFKPKLPGMWRPFTGIIKGRMRKAQVPSYVEFMESAIEDGAHVYACSMSMDMMGWKKEDMFDGVEVAGVATFHDLAADATISLAIG